MPQIISSASDDVINRRWHPPPTTDDDLATNFGEEEVKSLVVRLAELAVEAQKSRDTLTELQARAESLKERLRIVRRVKKDRPVRDVADEIHERVKLLESITKHRGENKD
jgi:anaerobic ribonucleoside-triphosphate reductase